MKDDKKYVCTECGYQSDEDTQYGICPKCGGHWYIESVNIVPSPTPLETVEEAADKFMDTIYDEIENGGEDGYLSKSIIKTFIAGYHCLLRQQLNFPENKQEQLNWFLVNVLRLFDDEQLKVLTKEIGERCGALRPMWQLCPKCNGQGIVSKPPHIAGDVQQWVSTASSFTCDVCNGAKIIAQPPISNP